MAVAFAAIEAVTDNEEVGNDESPVVRLKLDLAALGLV